MNTLKDGTGSTYFAVIGAHPTKTVGWTAPVIPFVFTLNIKGAGILLTFHKGRTGKGQNDYSQISAALHSAPMIEIKLLWLNVFLSIAIM